MAKKYYEERHYYARKYDDFAGTFSDDTYHNPKYANPHYTEWDFSGYKVYKLNFGSDGFCFWDTVLAHNPQEAVEYYKWITFGEMDKHVHTVIEYELEEISKDNIYELPTYICPPHWTRPEERKNALQRSHEMWEAMALKITGMERYKGWLDEESRKDNAEDEKYLTEKGFSKRIIRLKDLPKDEQENYIEMITLWDENENPNEDTIIRVEYKNGENGYLYFAPSEYTIEKLNEQKN